MLIRFRLSAIAIVADVEKAFLNVGLQVPDRDVTRFIWLKNPNNPEVGLSLLCFKICLLCLLSFPQFSACYACFYAFQKCIMLLFYVFFLCAEKFFI